MIKNALKKLKFPSIFAIFLATLLYFCIWQFSWIVFSVFIFLLILAAIRRYWLLFPILLVVASIGGFSKWTEMRQMQQQPTEVHAIRPIIDSLQVNGNLLSFRGRADGQTFQVYYTIQTEKEQQYFKKLSQNVDLQIDGTLSVPESQRNFNGFDNQKYLATQNIYRILTIKKINAISPQKDNLFDLHLWRRKAILLCQERFPAPMSSYMTGLLFGYLGKDFDEMSSIFTSLGIIHLFALSGMQVDFFIDGLRRLLLRLGMRRDIVDKLLLPFSFVYAFLTGLAVSVIRALFQKNLRLTGLDNFALTFFLMLIIMPKFLLTTGGQLSMLYAFLIAMISQKFRNLSGIKKSFLYSTVLSVGVLPLLILDFHVFQPLSIPLTLAFSVLFDLLMLPALLIIFILSALTGFSVNVNFFFQWLDNVAKFADNLFHYPLVLGTPSIALLLGLFLTTGLLIDFYRHKKIRWLLFPALIGLFFLCKNPVSPSITMVDIGQGDSFLLQDAWNKKTILIDTGGKVGFGGNQANWTQSVSQTNAEKTLIPYLLSRGIDTIDTVILTHTDDDHVGDIDALADKIKIKQIWIDKGALTNASMVKKLKIANVPVHTAQVGDSLPIFGSQLQVLSNGYTGKGDNNDSIVTYGNFFGTRFLFTGDLERAGEEELLQHYPNLKIDVLKAGHHGSKTSSAPDFIAAIQPKIALISVGKNNRYGHPNHETLDTFAANKVTVFRTDNQGAVRLTPISGKWQIQTVK